MSNYAIVIGINDYPPVESRGLKKLRGPIPDAKRVYDWLISYGGVPVENCHLFTSAASPLTPVKNGIDRAIVSIILDVQEKYNSDADRFYFYYAGHGLGVANDKENTGMCMADWEEYLADACCMSSSDYKKKFINEGLFKEIVLWMDCCRDPKFLFNPGLAPKILPSMGPNNTPRWMVAFGAQFGNPAFETVFTPDGNEMRGIFTDILLKGLYGAVNGAGPRPNVVELSDYLYYNVPLAAQEAGWLQEPEISHNTHSGNTIYF